MPEKLPDAPARDVVEPGGVLEPVGALAATYLGEDGLILCHDWANDAHFVVHYRVFERALDAAGIAGASRRRGLEALYGRRKINVYFDHGRVTLAKMAADDRSRVHDDLTGFENRDA